MKGKRVVYRDDRGDFAEGPLRCDGCAYWFVRGNSYSKLHLAALVAPGWTEWGDFIVCGSCALDILRLTKEPELHWRRSQARRRSLVVRLP